MTDLISSHVNRIIRFYSHVKKDINGNDEGELVYRGIINIINEMKIDDTLIKKATIDDHKDTDHVLNGACHYPFHHLWLNLAKSFHSKRTIVTTIKERDIKTLIIQQYFFHRPSYEKVKGKLDMKNDAMPQRFRKEYADTLYMNYYGNDMDARGDIADLLDNESWRNPYLHGNHAYNDDIHQILVQLMPLLPTILFLLFPLEYLPIFAFTLLLPSLMYSNHFSEATVHEMTLNPSTTQKEYQIRDKEDYFVVNQIPFMEISMKAATTAAVEKTEERLNIAGLILNERKYHLYRYPFQEDTYQPALIPFKINQTLSRAYYNTKRRLTHIDVVFEKNPLEFSQKYLLKTAHTSINDVQVYMAQRDDHSIVSSQRSEKSTQLGHKQIIRYTFIKTLPVPPKDINTVLMDNEGSLTIDHWKGNIRLPSVPSGKEFALEKEVRVLTAIKPLYTHPSDKYVLYFWYKGVHTRFNVNVPFFSDTTKYITIFPQPMEISDYINKHAVTITNERPEKDKVSTKGHQKLFNEEKKHKDDDVTVNQEYYGTIRKDGSEQGAIFPGISKNTGGKEGTDPSTTPAFRVLSIEETIGIVRDVDIHDENTVIDLHEISEDRTILQIHSPLLFHLHGEYRKCQASRLKSILSKLDHNPYGEYGLKVMVICTASQKDIVLSIIPLDSFNHELMTITTNAIGFKPIEDIEGSNFGSLKRKFLMASPTASPQYKNFIRVKGLFNDDDDDDDDEKDVKSGQYKVIFSNQPLSPTGANFMKESPFGRVKNTFYTTLFDGQFSKRVREDKLSIASISDIRIVITGKITVKPFTYDGNARIQIFPLLKTIIVHFRQEGIRIRLLDTRLKKGNTLTIAFIVDDMDASEYIENGLIDKFELRFTNIQYDVSAIEIIYHKNPSKPIVYTQNKSIGPIQSTLYMMRIHTTDNKLASYVGKDSLLTYLVHDIKEGFE
jgi:hypothetical protein